MEDPEMNPHTNGHLTFFFFFFLTKELKPSNGKKKAFSTNGAVHPGD
jgi:hypothetical protein